MNQPIRLYYAATILFLALDYLFGINVRVAFFDGVPGLRAVYYLVLFGCLALILWRPGWAVLVGTIESGFAFAALTIGIGSRLFVVTDQMIETGIGYVTFDEIINYLLVAGSAYFAWARGAKQLQRSISD